MNTFTSNFLTRDQAEALVVEHGSPLYVYSGDVLRRQATQCLTMQLPFGHTVRYAMKANPNPEILKVLHQTGMAIDASSEYEAASAIKAGFAPQDILLTSQQLPKDLKVLVEQGVQFNACSLRQLEAYGKLFPGTEISIRLNPGVGTGANHKVMVGGPTASFGIWHEYVPQVQQLVERYGLRVVRVHAYGGCWTDADLWDRAVDATLALLTHFEHATIVNIGSGFPVARNDGEPEADMQEVAGVLAAKLRRYHQQTGRKMHLEIEPGTFIAANAGMIAAQVEDVVDTGINGYTFIKLNTGMTELLRPILYASQHPIAILNDATEQKEYVVVGHCCESGDLLTPDPNDPERLATRTLPVAQVNDVVLIGGCGAYAASLAAHGYNSFPRTAEVMVGGNGDANEVLDLPA